MPENVAPDHPVRAALVTGAARGLGEGIARRLLQDGWAVLLTDITSEVSATAATLARESGVPEGRAVGLVADVANEAQVEHAIATALSTFGRLDLAVANAGIGGKEVDLIDLDPAEFDRIVSINLKGVYLTARAAGRIMREAREGVIVTISSIFGVQPYPRTAIYSATKAGVIALTRAFSLEMAPYNVRVNTIAPGYMATEMQWEGLRARAAQAGITFEEERQRVWEKVPLSRHGTPEEVGGVVAFLASADAAYITGATIGVHGGVIFS